MSIDYDKYLLKLGVRRSYDVNLPYVTELKQRFNHFYIIGKSGMGKSVLMERMADYDMKFGLSVIFIDPKGDSVNRLAGNPNTKYISFNHPVKMNPLRRRGYKVDTLIREFIDVMDIMITSTTINPESTVRMIELLTNAIIGFKEEDRNIKKLYEFLTFKAVRQSYKYSDPMIGEWFKEIEDLKKSGMKKVGDYENTMSSISSRLSRLLKNDEMNRFIIDGESEFDLADIIESGQSLLVNTSTGYDDNQLFLSALILHSIYSYIRENRIKKPLLVYLDEFQKIANSSFPSLLQFARSCRVGFTLAHHDFLAIEPKVLSSIFGISSSYIVFNCGDTEAKRLADIVRVKQSDIMDLPEFCAYSRLGIKNSHFKTFPPLINSFVPPFAEEPTEPTYNFLSNDWIVV
jgi:type IV secretory pathway VirB4 component